MVAPSRKNQKNFLSGGQLSLIAVVCVGVGLIVSSVRDQQAFGPTMDTITLVETTISEGSGHAGILSLTNAQSPDLMEKMECSEEAAANQEARMRKRFGEWWSHSACPDQVWMEEFPSLLKKISVGEEEPKIVLDIGCNKGYTSADFMDLFSPVQGMNPKSLHDAITAVAKEDNSEYERSCGVCNDCNKPRNPDPTLKEAIEVHCFEPSPATYNMLTRVRDKFSLGDNDSSSWKIHNLGLGEISSTLSWHKVCQDSVGNELCGIVPEDTPDSIKVDVVSVDDFVAKTYPQNDKLIHMLKIDAEGLDPAVLQGSEKTLKAHRAVMVMYEFNPGLRDKNPPYGMWGKGGTKTLLGVSDWLDDLGYDCYVDSRVKGPEGVEAPALYRITGGCIRNEPNIRGWANVVCVSRAFPDVAKALIELAPLAKA